VLCCFVQEQHSGGEQRSGIHTAQRGSVEDQELAALILPKYSSIEASRLMEAFEDGYEAACLGESVLECGLRLVASEHVPADMNAQSDALLMLLLAPATQQVKLSLNPGPDPDPDPDPDPYLTLTLTLTPTPTPTLTLALTLLLPLPST
jgi:hypothetical protein